MALTGKSTFREIRCLVASWFGLGGAPPCILVGRLALERDLLENAIAVRPHASPTCPNWTEIVTRSHGRGGDLARTWPGPGPPTVFYSLVCVYCGFPSAGRRRNRRCIIANKSTASDGPHDHCLYLLL